MTTAPPRTDQHHALEKLIAISDITTGRYSMRWSLDETQLADLAASMSQVGLINPVTVTQHDQITHLVSGHRRCAAAELLGWTHIRARIIQRDDPALWATAWAENAARDDITPVDQAHWLARYLEHTGTSQAEAARQLGMSPQSLSETLGINAYPADVLDALQAGSIQARVARELSRIDDPPTRQFYARQAAEYGCTARTASEWVRNWNAGSLPSDQHDNGGEPAHSGQPIPATHQVLCAACHNPIIGGSVLVSCCATCARMIAAPGQ